MFIKNYTYFLILSLCLATPWYMSVPVKAQGLESETEFVSTEATLKVDELKTEEEDTPPLSVQDTTSYEDISSLFFTPETLALVRDAVRGLNANAFADSGDDASPKDPGIRELALGGIVFKAEDDWTIWLNGRRVTPDAIPSEIYDMKVNKTYVDIKWYDAYTNRLFPVRLRANERFNLDSRLFLTGQHSEDQQL